MTFKTPKSQVLIKFLLLLGLLAANFLYLSLKFDMTTGGIASALTWSFFVLCTPVADAGFLLDFPLRLLFGIRMVLSEMAVWTLAISTNVATLLLAPQYYDTTILTRILHQILITPWPYWSVTVLAAMGTFLSIRFGDELMDILHHRDRSFFHAHHFKYELILIAFFLMVLLGYFELIRGLGLDQVL